MLAGDLLLDVLADVRPPRQGDEAQQLVPGLGDVVGPIVGVREPIVTSVGSHADPVRSHVVELRGLVCRMLEVADQLVKDPCLLGVRHTLARLQRDRSREQLRPRQVVHLYGRVRLDA